MITTFYFMIHLFFVQHSLKQIITNINKTQIHPRRCSKDMYSGPSALVTHTVPKMLNIITKRGSTADCLKMHNASFANVFNLNVGLYFQPTPALKGKPVF